MKRINISNIVLQADIPDDADPDEFAAEVLHNVNLTLQREPYGYAAQIFECRGIETKVEDIDA